MSANESTLPSKPEIVAPVMRQIAVADIARSLAFYRDVLGFEARQVLGGPGSAATADVVYGPARIQFGPSGRAPAILFFQTGDVAGMRAAIAAPTDRGIASLIEFAEKNGGEIDVLVNNAGSLVRRAKLLEQTPEPFDEVINLNVKSAYFVTKAVAPHMIAKGGGIVVNLSSIAARNGGGVGATIYAAAKAAVSCMTKGLARELGPHGIRVNAVSPGTVDNDFHVQFSTRQMLDAVIAATPAGRLGTNEEVSDTILFLCSHAARYIQGQTIEINGGMYMV